MFDYVFQQLKGYLIQKQKIEQKTTEFNASKALLLDKKQVPPTQKSKTQTQSSIKTKDPQRSENTDPVNVTNARPQSGQSVLNFAEFLKSLLTLDSGGRIIREEKCLKFLLLNPSDHFSDLLVSARY